MLFSPADPLYSALHPPGQDPVPEAPDPVPLGGLLQLCGQDSADHTGGTHTHTHTHTRLNMQYSCTHTIIACLSCGCVFSAVWKLLCSHSCSLGCLWRRVSPAVWMQPRLPEGRGARRQTRDVFRGRLAAARPSIVPVVCSCQIPFSAGPPAGEQPVSLLWAGLQPGESRGV